MPRRSEEKDDGLTDADRRAIADIRRELDADFGPLDPAEPLAAEPSPAPLAAPRRQARARRERALPLFFLGALVGGVVGGITGATTTLLWLELSEPRPPRVAVSPTRDRGAAVGESPAAAVPERPFDRAAVESALSEWIAATKAGDIDRQMRFYPSRVPVYYTWRDVPRDAVRAEKRRVFGGATRLEIVTDAPTIEPIDDGTAAVSRFRKRYVIEGPTVRRRGEVVQELRWVRTSSGWRIVAERDAEVLTPSAPVAPNGARRGGTIEPAR